MPLAIYTSAAWSANGGLSPASQAQVEVVDESTGALASIFSDRAGNNGLANPFQADDQGRFSFFVSGGAYKVTVTSGGETHTLRYQAIGTAKENDTTANGGKVATYGQTEAASLTSGVLTIPAGLSTIKLPSTVWDGSSNITISGFAFENGVQPEPGYEFALVIPKTGVASAGTLGNEVLLQHGTSLQVSANGFADLPCYPNAADNPGTDPVQYAAPYYRLKMRVESYDGSGDPVVSVEELPGAVSGSNDRGSWVRWATNLAEARVAGFPDTEVIGEAGVWTYAASFSASPAATGTSATRGSLDGGEAEVVHIFNTGEALPAPSSTDIVHGSTRSQSFRSSLYATGEWY